MNKTMALVLATLPALAAGYWLGSRSASAPEARPEVGAADQHTAAQAELWTCPMHPQIQLPSQVPCPLCGMDLVPAGEGSDSELILDPAQVALAQVETSPVERRIASRDVRLVGMVEADESETSVVAARVAGRLERLFVDYAGVPVQRGDHLVELYSPVLLAAQEELLASAARKDESGVLAGAYGAAYEAARSKLLLFGLDEQQIAALELAGAASDRIVLNSPVSGTVMHRHGEEGGYVQEGSPIYEVANLQHIWIELEAFEQDLPWLRYGQLATIQVEALPGASFEGTVSFLAPEVDRQRRTTTVRISLENEDGRLKPGMFATATVRAHLGRDGVTLPVSLEGKWVSPMHPEIIHDQPGSCDVCGMDLVPAESLGLVAPGEVAPALVIPASAVLPTGRRAVVYVERRVGEQLSYESRAVVLGARAGDDYLVHSGLQEGERVVTRGAFRIDSAMQIRGLPSALTLPGQEGAPGAAGEPLRRSLEPFWFSVLELTEALAADDPEAALAIARSLPEDFALAQPGNLPPRARRRFDELQPALLKGVQALAAAGGEASLRAALEPFSQQALDLAEAFGVPASGGVQEVHCPMALDGAGASWIQRAGPVSNPYFGSSMLRCGTPLRRLESVR